MVERNSDKMQVTNCYRHILALNENFTIKTDNEYVLIYFKHGSSKIILEGKAYIANKNNVALIKPHKEIIVSSIEFSSEFICIFYKGGESDYLFEFSVFRLSKVVSVSDCEVLLPFFENILDEYLDGMLKRYNCISEIYSIFSLLTPATKGRNAPRYVNKFLQEAIAIIETNPEKHISVNELAERVNIDRSYLYKRFVEETGMTPKEYIMDYKLQLSAKKLKLKSSNVQKVLAQLGFSSYRVFEQAFKKKYNVNPKEYQQMFSKKDRG